MAAIDTWNTPPVHQAMDATAVTPNDSTDLGYITRALYIGGDGDVKVTMKGGSAVTFSGCAAGTVLPICCTRVWSTGTTATLATLILALY